MESCKAFASKAALIAAFSVPPLISFNSDPLYSLYNQLAGIGLFGIAVASIQRPESSANRRTNWTPSTFSVAVTLIGMAAVVSAWLTRPDPVALDVALFAAATLIAHAAGRRFASLPRHGTADANSLFFFVIAVCIAGVLGSIPGLFQLISSGAGWDGWIADAASPDRISGNLRQPNHLATVCACGAAAASAALTRAKISTRRFMLIALLLCLVLAATGSRVGWVEAIAIGGWGLADRVSTSARRLLIGAIPFLVLLCWLALRYWSAMSGVPHARPPDLSSGRYEMWRQCLAMISTHPWRGVGVGNFNFAWTLTPFDRSNPETFDHAHNLLLHWAVELGVPFTLLLVSMFGYSFWACVQRSRLTQGEERVVRRFCLLLITIVLIHSMTEYPLWYAYFLLPTAMAWGIASAPPMNPTARPVQSNTVIRDVTRHDGLRLCGLSMTLAAALAAFDYQKIVTLYHPFDGAPPLEQRIADARATLLYGYLADRFAGTLAVPGSRSLAPYRTATRQVLDMRLLISWSIAAKEVGELDKARYLAERVRDFNDPVAQQFFDACSTTPTDGTLPWQCTPPTVRYTYDNFF